MENRVVQSTEDPGQEGVEDKDEVVSSSVGGSGPSVIRPSAFKLQTGGVTLAPSKFQPSSNPWKSPAANDTSEAINSNPISNNPFAEVTSHHGVSTASSDSEDERKDKPVVAPGHNFNTAKSYIGPSKLVAAPAPSPSKCLLRPSALDKQTSHFKNHTSSTDSSSSIKSTFKLEPAKLQSPLGFGKHSQSNKENQSTQDSKVDSTEPEHKKQTETAVDNSAAAAGANNLELSGANGGAAGFNSGSKEKGPFMFGQQMHDRALGRHSSPGGFLFGQNLSQRVTAAADSTEFQDLPQKVEDEHEPLRSESNTKSLEESAAVEQAKHAKTVIQEEVEVTTGEEDESNVFQLNAKLYAFDHPTQSWLERGRGTLRLNDMKRDDETSFQSRLVMRTHGSLRVILNTKIWGGQTIERASQKSVRITAWDGDEGVKVFLIMAQPKDADQIFSAIDWRIQGCKKDEQKKKDTVDTVDQVSSAENADKETQKRRRDSNTKEADTPTKKQKVDGEPRKVHLAEESNDSSTVDPETEASSESFTSSPTVKSTSSDN